MAASWLAFWQRSYRIARGATLVSAGTLVCGWVVAQAPHLVGPVTIYAAAASRPALTGVAIAIGIVLVSVLPAMFLLFGLYARPSPKETH